MERKFLEDFGLEKGQVDAILNASSHDIGKKKAELKTVTVQRDELQEQLNAVQDRLKAFEGIDVEAMNSEIEELKKNLAAKDEEFQSQLEERTFTDILSKEIDKLKGRNAKSVIAQLDIEGLRASSNREEDIKTALGELKDSAPYLFETDRTIPVITQGANPKKSKSLRSFNSTTDLNEHRLIK